MTNPRHKFSWNRLFSALKSFGRQVSRGFAEESLRDYSPDHLPYIEVMLPITGVVAPITFERKRPHQNSAPGRLG